MGRNIYREAQLGKHVLKAARTQLEKIKTKRDTESKIQRRSILDLFPQTWEKKMTADLGVRRTLKNKTYTPNKYEPQFKTSDEEIRETLYAHCRPEPGVTNRGTSKKCKLKRKDLDSKRFEMGPFINDDTRISCLKRYVRQ